MVEIKETTDGISRMNKKKPPPSVWQSLALVGQLGFTIAVPLALGAILGNYLDGIAHQKTLFLLLGLLLGLIVGIYGAYRLFARLF
jgi:ATP synthase protein I